MTTHKTFAAIVGAIALLAAACGGDGGAEESAGDDRQAVIDWLIAQDETPESAACFADELPDYTVADFEAFEAAESEEDMPEGMAVDVLAAAAACLE